MVLALLALTARAAAPGGPATRAPSPTAPADDRAATEGSCWTISPDHGPLPDGSLGGEESAEAALDEWAAGIQDTADSIDAEQWTRSTDGEQVSFTQGTWSATFFQGPAGDWVLRQGSGCS